MREFITSFGDLATTAVSGEESHARFRGVVEELGLAACCVCDGRVVYASPALGQVLHCEGVEEYRAAETAELLDVAEIRRLAIETRGARDEVVPLPAAVVQGRRRNGQVVQFELRGVVEGTEEGVVVRCVLHDLTELERARIVAREEEERFEQLAASINEVLWISKRPDGTVQYVSAAFSHIWGVPAEALYREPRLWLESICPEDRARAEAELRKPEFDVEYRIRRPDGEERWVRNRSTPRGEWANGGPTMGVVEDITANKEHLRSLRRRERYYRSLIQNASDLITVVGPNLQVRFLSPAVGRTLGYGPRTPRPGSVAEWIHPADLSHVEAVVRRVLHEPTRPQVARYRLRHRDGSWRVHEATATALQEEGEGVSVIVNSHDVTDRKMAEDELRDSQVRYELATRATTDVIWDWDLSSGQITWSDMVCTVFGYDPADIEPSFEWWEQQIHAEDRGRVTESILAVMRSGQFWTQEYRFRTGDGSYATVIHRAYVIRAEGGQPARFVGAMADFTERKQLQEQLYQSQRLEAIGRLAGGVAHDFNNILMVIQGAASLALMDLAEDGPVRASLSDIQRATSRAKNLTKQLLAFGRRQVLKPKVISLNESILELEKMTGRLLGEDVRLATALARDIWPVEVDPVQLQQVIINLAVNARDAMPQGGELLIQTENVRLEPEDTARFTYTVKPGEYARLTVTDTGCGMDQATLSQAFEPFFTTKEEGKGTGLGLSTVYGIVKQSGGYIWVDSAAGKGTTFRIYLPRSTRTFSGDAPQPDTLRTPGGSGRILLVEDEDEVRAITRKILEKSGYTVLEAPNGARALEIFEENGQDIDLLLTDVVMPGMSGRDVAAHIVSARPEVKVLYTSGHTDDRILHYGIGHEGLSFLQKPFSPDALLHRLHEILVADPSPTP